MGTSPSSCLAECFFLFLIPMCGYCIDQCIKHHGDHCPHKANILGGALLQQSQERPKDVNE